MRDARLAAASAPASWMLNGPSSRLGSTMFCTEGVLNALTTFAFDKSTCRWPATEVCTSVEGCG